MLTFDATPDRVREVTKLAYRLGVSITGLNTYWDSLTKPAQIPGLAFNLRSYQLEGVAHLEKWDGNALIADEPVPEKPQQ